MIHGERQISHENFQLHRLIRCLSISSIQKIFLISKFCKYKKGYQLYTYDNEISHLYLLLSGRIKIAYCKNNIEIVSEILLDGDIFGELSLTAYKNSKNEFAEVISNDATVCILNLKDFIGLVQYSSEISYSYSKLIIEKLNVITGKYCDIIYKDARERILNFFCLHAQHEGKCKGNKTEIIMLCTHQDIANFTATSRQTVSSVINCLIKEKKIIYVGRSKVIIPDMNLLKS